MQVKNVKNAAVIDCEEGTHAVEDKLQLLRGASSVCVLRNEAMVGKFIAKHPHSQTSLIHHASDSGTLTSTPNIIIVRCTLK